MSLTLMTAGTSYAAHATQSDSKTGSHPHPQRSEPSNLTGRITDIITARDLVYVEVDTGSEKVWAAGRLDDSLRAGDTISFSATMPMQNFHSKSLSRDFAVIYFVQEFITGKRDANTAAPTLQSGNPQAHSPVARTQGEVVEGGLLLDASLDGLNTENRLLSDYQGKPLIINVWASWCTPCRQEMGSLERLASRYNGKLFNIIGISTDDYRDRAAAFIDEADLSFDNFIDHALRLENMLGASTIPLTVLVDADGRVLQKVRGSRDWDSPELIKAIGDVFQVKLI